MRHHNPLFSFFIMPICMIGVVLALSSCTKLKGEAKYPSGADRTTTGGDIYGEKKSVFGNDGLSIFGKKKKEGGETGIGVNSYLWRASLDTISFMPLASADPFGGVIITDWYAAEENPNERFKANVFILDKQLVSTGVTVKLFRQTHSKGRWIDGKVTSDMTTQLEDAILTRARQLRVADLEQ